MNESTESPLANPETQLVAPAVAELIPFAQHEDWGGITDEERQRVTELVNIFTEVAASPRGIVASLRTIAQANAGRRGWSFCNLRTLFYAWSGQKKDWRVLARSYRHDTSLPVEFIAHLRTLCLKEHRSRQQAINKIRSDWREGKAIPGYGTWREWFAVRWPDREVPRAFAGDYPEGWSNSNLRLHMPMPAQQELATAGYAAAHKHIPHVIRDTSSLRPMEMIVFDDFECDVLAIYQRRVVRVRGVLAIDVATRRKLAVGFKPLLTDDEGKKRAITRADVQFLIKQILSRYGVPADYPVTLLVENAAAAIGDGLQAALEMFFHGQVRVQRTNMLEHRTLANGFVESGGKPWEKGWIESAFNLMHNLAGALPGQKGARYDLAPATTEARIAYCDRLLGEKLGLTEEQLAQLRLPIESFDTLIGAYERIFDAMDRRTEHKLQGFEQVSEWCRGPGDPWHPFAEIAALPQAEQLGVEVRARLQSPLERWERLAANCRFTKVPDFLIALLAFTPKKVEARNRKVTFTHAGAGYTYLDVDDCLVGLPEGSKLLGYFDESAAGRLYLTDLKGRRIGVLRYHGAADIKDPEAIGEAAALVREFFHKQIQGPVRELLAADDSRLAADRAHNDARLAEFRPAVAEAPAPRLPLSRQLALDTVTSSPAERFADATAAAAAVAADVQDEAVKAGRRASARTPKHDLGALVDDTAAAGDDAGLDRLMT